MLSVIRRSPYIVHLAIILSPLAFVAAYIVFRWPLPGQILGAAAGSIFPDTHPVNFITVLLIGVLWRGSNEKLFWGLVAAEVVLFIGNRIINAAYFPPHAPLMLFLAGDIYGGIVIGFIWNFLSKCVRNHFTS